MKWNSLHHSPSPYLWTFNFSYLHSKLDNGRSIQAGGKGPHVFMEFCNYTGSMQTYVDYRPCADGHGEVGTTDVCIQFSVSICMLCENLARF